MVFRPFIAVKNMLSGRENLKYQNNIIFMTVIIFWTVLQIEQIHLSLPYDDFRHSDFIR